MAPDGAFQWRLIAISMHEFDVIYVNMMMFFMGRSGVYLAKKRPEL